MCKLVEWSFLWYKRGFLLVEIDKQNKFTWEYVSYGWEAKITGINNLRSDYI